MRGHRTHVGKVRAAPSPSSSLSLERIMAFGAAARGGEIYNAPPSASHVHESIGFLCIDRDFYYVYFNIFILCVRNALQRKIRILHAKPKRRRS